jgi:hypothetical protein
MNRLADKKQIERLWAGANLAALGLLAIAANAALAGPQGPGVTTYVRSTFPITPSDLVWIDLWIGVALAGHLARLLEVPRLCRDLRLLSDAVGAVVLGRMVVAGNPEITPGWTAVGRALLVVVLAILLLGAADKLANLLRGRDAWPTPANREIQTR